jgi:hypothetical protein
MVRAGSPQSKRSFRSKTVELVLKALGTGKKFVGMIAAALRANGEDCPFNVTNI